MLRVMARSPCSPSRADCTAVPPADATTTPFSDVGPTHGERSILFGNRSAPADGEVSLFFPGDTLLMSRQTPSLFESLECRRLLSGAFLSRGILRVFGDGA